MDINILNNGPVFALVGVLLTVAFNYLIQLRKGGTDIQIADRKTLSEDQENFKNSILEQLKQCRADVDKLTQDNTTWKEKAIAVQEQKLELTEKIIALNQKLLETDKTVLILKDTLEKLKNGEKGITK